MTSLPNKLSILFAGGGTGGHFYPAVALADRLSETLSGRCDLKINFVGTRRGIEYRMRKNLRYPLELINIRGLARSLSLKNLLVPFAVVGSLVKSRKIISHLKPDLVVGTGGYVSWPVLKMAGMMNIPYVLQEQNSYPGMVTRRLAAGAKRIYLGFGEAADHLARTETTRVTGNPVRESVLGGSRQAAMEKFGLDPTYKTILVLGGSQGARSINQAILKSLNNDSLPSGWQLLWQTGRLDHDELAAKVENKPWKCRLFAFETAMDQVYAAADMVIARAGAVSLAEIEAVRCPAILIPYPHAAGDHQRHNARAYVKRQVATVVDPDDLENRDVLKLAGDIVQDGQFEAMRNALEQLSSETEPAVDKIVNDLITLLPKTMETESDR